MKKLKIRLAVISILLAVVKASEVFEIYRRKSTDVTGSEEGTDSFKIPPSLCLLDASNSTNCARFNARAPTYNSDGCYCSCSNENSTFIFTDGKWTCSNNSALRDLLGYSVLTFTSFYPETKSSQLRVLDDSEEKRINILSLLPVQNCRVDNTASFYVGCDGVEVPFISSQLAIINKRVYDADGGIQHFLKVYNNEPSSDFIRGRIIKLTIRCDYKASPLNRLFTRYLLFKYVGNVSCPVSPSSLQKGSVSTRDLRSSPLPSMTKHIMATKSIKTDSMISSPSFTVITIPNEIMSTSTATTQSAISDGSPTVAEPLRTISATPSSTFVIQETAVPSPSKTTFSDGSQRSKSGSEGRTEENTALSLSVMAGIIASAAVLFTLVIVGCLVYHQRKLKKAPSASTVYTDHVNTNRVSVASSPQTNRAFQSDDQDMYRQLSFQEAPIYASYHRQDTHPPAENPREDHYAQLNISEEQNIYGPRETQEPMYNVLEEHVSESGVIYENYGFTGEEPEEPETVYNVLEEPSDDSSEGSDHGGSICEDGPVYKNVSHKSSQDCVAGSNNDSELTNEPVYKNMEDITYQSDSTDDDFVTRDDVRSILKTLSRIEKR